MWTEQQYETAARLAEEEREAALERHREMMSVSKGSSDGVCVDCRGDIPAARLNACPNALRCIECQTDHDRRN